MLTLSYLPVPKPPQAGFSWFSDIRARILQDGQHVGDVNGGFLDFRAKARSLQMLRIRPPKLSLHPSALGLISPQGTVLPLSVLDSVSDVVPRGILRVDLLRLRPGFSGQDLGLLALRQFIHEVARGPCLVQLRALPLPRPHDPLFDTDTRENRCLLRSKLLAHYARVGILPIEAVDDPTGAKSVWCQASVPDAQGWIAQPTR